MTTSQRFTWGLVLGIGGGLLFTGGAALTASLIGACVGVPMALLGLPAMIVGVVWTRRAQFEKAQETIAAGVREGIRASAQQDLRPPQLTSASPRETPAEGALASQPVASHDEPAPPSLRSIDELATDSTESAHPTSER